MAIQIITRAELIAYAERAGVSGFIDSQYDTAIARAIDRIRQAALNEYTSESFEALTAGTAPDEMRDHALALALHILTKGDAGRPSSIGDGNVEAKSWLAIMVAGKTHYDRSPGAVLVKADTPEDGVSYQVPDRMFDRKKNDYFGVPRRS